MRVGPAGETALTFGSCHAADLSAPDRAIWGSGLVTTTRWLPDLWFGVWAGQGSALVRPGEARREEESRD